MSDKISECKRILKRAFQYARKRDIARLIFGVFLLMLIQPMTPTVAQTPITEVPFEILSEYTASTEDKHQGPVIGVRINGGQKVERFLIDTGSTGIIVNKSTAKRYQLKESEQQFRINEKLLQSKGTQSDSIPSGRRASIETIEIGDFEFEGEVLVIDDAILNRVLGKHEIAGVIGMDILSQFAVEINSSSRKVKLFAYGKLSTAKLQEIGYIQPNNKGTSLVTNSQISTIKQSSDKQNEGESREFFVAVQIDNALTIPLFVDTGSQRTKVSLEFQKKLKDKRLKQSGLESIGIGREVSFQVATCDLALADEVIKNVEVAFFKQSDLDNFPGVLGMDVMSQFIVLLDFPAKKAYLRKP